MLKLRNGNIRLGAKKIQQQEKFVSFQCKRHKIAKQNFIDKRLHGLNWPELFNRACCCFFADLNIHIFFVSVMIVLMRNWALKLPPN